MIQLYTRINNQLRYWEGWEKDNKTAIFHWGVVGEQGEDKEVKVGFFTSVSKTIQKEADQQRMVGYFEIDESELAFLEIEYLINGFGTEADLEKRHRLEEKMDEVLGSTGLGHCNGGSTGSGTMEVGCMVVDFDIAKMVVEKKLSGTEFSDYSRIFQMTENRNDI
jgi:hypothetical protein